MFPSACSAPRWLGRPRRRASAPPHRLEGPRFSSLSDIRSSYESTCRPAAAAIYPAVRAAGRLPERHHQGRERCPGRLRLSSKCASAWKLRPTCPPFSDRFGNAELGCWRLRAPASPALRGAADLPRIGAASGATGRGQESAERALRLTVERATASANQRRGQRFIVAGDRGERLSVSAGAPRRPIA